MEDLWELQALTTAHEHVPESMFVSHPEQARTLALLHDVSRELTSILDRETLLRRIAQRVKRLVDYDVFSVMLLNERSEILESAFAMRYDESVVLCQQLTLDQGLCGASARARRPIRVGDVLLDARYIRCETGADIRSELIVPLLLQDRLIGVLDLESVEPEAFTAEHERMMVTLGSYVAIALENARLFENAHENERRLQLDLDTAREIQLRLLPTGAREVPGLDLGVGYLPARELGGDFYDFLATGEGRLAIAAGDVSGKGTAAALFGSLAIGMLREHILEHPCPPAEMLAMLNRGLHSGRLEGRFIALTYAIYNALTRQLTLSNAGQPWPLLFRDGVAQCIEVAGVPLGLFPGSQYDEMTLQLVPGDVVLFASDGIFDCENGAEEQFGRERTEAAVASLVPQDSARAIAEGILRATDEHSAGTSGPSDDRTIIVLRVTNEPLADTWSKLPVIY
jgi:sigma-B regulation protein RsbU (phosphoserine phosphatase)